MDRYKDWMCDLMDDTTDDVLSTVKKILKDNSNDELTQTQLEKLNLCWDIIRDMHKIKLTKLEIESHKTPGKSA